jgi:hypothetical protein
VRLFVDAERESFNLFFFQSLLLLSLGSLVSSYEFFFHSFSFTIKSKKSYQIKQWIKKSFNFNETGLLLLLCERCCNFDLVPFDKFPRWRLLIQPKLEVCLLCLCWCYNTSFMHSNIENKSNNNVKTINLKLPQPWYQPKHT